MTNKFFTYKSPQAVDKENDKILFKFFTNFPCKCVEMVAKSSWFELRVDKERLTVEDAGDRLVSI